MAVDPELDQLADLVARNVAGIDLERSAAVALAVAQARDGMERP